MRQSVQLRPWQAYLFALFATAATLGLYRLLSHGPDGDSIVIVFVIPILLTAYLGGMGPGLLATALSCLSTAYYILPPIGSFQVASGADRWKQLFLFAAGVVASLTQEASYRTRDPDLNSGERLQAERLLECERILDGLDEMIVVIDRNYRYVLANRSFLKFRGLERQQLVGRSVAEVVDKDVFENVIKNKLDECLKDGPLSYELTYHLPQHGERDLMFSYFPIEGPGGIDRVACVLRDITDRKDAAKHLQASRVEARSLATDLRTAREDEAVRISREIHDQLGQALIGVQMDVTSLRRALIKRGQPRQRAGTMSKLDVLSVEIEKTLQIARHIASELRPAILDELGLVAAIEWQTREFEERSSIFCNLTLPDQPVELDRARATAVFRIFQEVLTNVARHAQATEVSVTVRIDAEAMVLKISDNGVGMEISEVKTRRGHGLLGIEERADAAGLRVQLVSQPGQGTTTTIEMPIGAGA